jgi:hypothetical protein
MGQGPLLVRGERLLIHAFSGRAWHPANEKIGEAYSGVDRQDYGKRLIDSVVSNSQVR